MNTVGDVLGSDKTGRLLSSRSWQIGAGHGKFSCLVLQHLLEMREFLPTLAPKGGGNRREGQGGEVNAPGQSETSGGSGGTRGETADSRTATTDGDTAVPNEGERRPGGANRNGTAASRQESETVGDGGAGSSKAEDKGAQAWQGSEAADGLPFRYVVTDVAQVRREKWDSHAILVPWIFIGGKRLCGRSPGCCRQDPLFL